MAYPPFGALAELTGEEVALHATADELRALDAQATGVQVFGPTDGKALVVDYKTNWIGDSSPEDIVEEDYRLQRLVYALACFRAGAEEVEAVASSGGDRAVLVDPTSAARTTGLERDVAVRGLRGRTWVTERAGGRDWRVQSSGFWQVHPGAADTLVSTVREALAPHPVRLVAKIETMSATAVAAMNTPVPVNTPPFQLPRKKAMSGPNSMKNFGSGFMSGQFRQWHSSGSARHDRSSRDTSHSNDLQPGADPCRADSPSTHPLPPRPFAHGARSALSRAAGRALAQARPRA